MATQFQKWPIKFTFDWPFYPSNNFPLYCTLRKHIFTLTHTSYVFVCQCVFYYMFVACVCVCQCVYSRGSHSSTCYLRPRHLNSHTLHVTHQMAVSCMVFHLTHCNSWKINLSCKFKSLGKALNSTLIAKNGVKIAEQSCKFCNFYRSFSIRRDLMHT